MKFRMKVIVMLASVGVSCALPSRGFAGLFRLEAEPKTANLQPGQSTSVDVYLREMDSALLSGIGLSVATLLVDVATPAMVNPQPAELLSLSAGPSFLTGPSDPTPGLITVFSPDPNLFGVLSTGGRIQIASFEVRLPVTALPGSPTKFEIRAIDDFQFISVDDFHFEPSSGIEPAVFEVNPVAVPCPSSAVSAAAMLSMMSLRRRRKI